MHNFYDLPLIRLDSRNPVAMLESPAFSDENIISCLLAEYGLNTQQIVFLPLGADRNTAVYRLLADDKRLYFLKLRAGEFDELSVKLPRFLSYQGVEQVIPALATITGQLWGQLDRFKTILYPYVEGRHGYEVGLSDRQWVEFGQAIKAIHTTPLPEGLSSLVRRERYDPHWREKVKAFLSQIERDNFEEPVAIEMAAFLKVKKNEILNLVLRAEQLAAALQEQTQEYILCHSDLHAGNLLVGAHDSFYIVDWDDPLLAPKERDLMFIGGGLLGGWCTPQKEETLFYRGYGQTQIDPNALAYFRHERILQDIAVYCEQIFLTVEDGEDRMQSLHYLKSNFLSQGTIAQARKADQILRLEQTK